MNIQHLLIFFELTSKIQEKKTYGILFSSRIAVPVFFACGCASICVCICHAQKHVGGEQQQSLLLLLFVVSNTGQRDVVDDDDGDDMELPSSFLRFQIFKKKQIFASFISACFGREKKNEIHIVLIHIQFAFFFFFFFKKKVFFQVFFIHHKKSS